jgi:hypothetical protein
VLIFSQLRTTKNELDTRTEDMSAAFVEGKMELSKFLTVRCCLPSFALLFPRDLLTMLFVAIPTGIFGTARKVSRVICQAENT